MSETLPSVIGETLLDLWDLAMCHVRDPPSFACETLPSVICGTLFCHMWDPTFCHMSDLAFSHMWSFAFCPMCDPAFYETQPSFTCWALPSVRPCSLWEPAFLWGLPSCAFCETLPLFIMLDPLWDLAFCETLHSVRPCLLWGPASVRARPSSNMWDLASVRLCLCFRCKNVPYVSPCYEWHTLLSVRLCPLWGPALPWDPGFCEALPSVRPWLLWNFAFCEALTLFILWYPAFCETLPLFNGLCLLWSRAFVWDHLWDLAFRETLASVRPCCLWDPGFCEALPSVRPFLLWDPALFIMLDPLWDLAFFEALPSVRPCLPGFCEALPSVRPFLLWDPGFVYFMIPCLSGRHCLCLMGETLSSVKPCLSVRPCLPWCVRPCRLFNLYRKMCYMSIDCILLLS